MAIGKHIGRVNFSPLHLNGGPGAQTHLSIYTSGEAKVRSKNTGVRKQWDVPPFYSPELDDTIVPEALAINILIPLMFYIVLACRHTLQISSTPRLPGHLYMG